MTCPCSVVSIMWGIGWQILSQEKEGRKPRYCVLHLPTYFLGRYLAYMYVSKYVCSHPHHAGPTFHDVQVHLVVRPRRLVPVTRARRSSTYIHAYPGYTVQQKTRKPLAWKPRPSSLPPHRFNARPSLPWVLGRGGGEREREKSAARPYWTSRPPTTDAHCLHTSRGMSQHAVGRDLTPGSWAGCIKPRWQTKQAPGS